MHRVTIMLSGQTLHSSSRFPSIHEKVEKELLDDVTPWLIQTVTIS